MSRAGQVFTNPVSGERVVILTDPDAHPERVLVGHLFVAPGGRVAAEHYHPTITERFHVLEGQVGFMIGGSERVLGAGEHAEVPAGALRSSEVVDPDPRALGLLGPDGRLVFDTGAAV